MDKLIQTEKVNCAICGEKFKSISHSHLKKHGMTIKEYMELYPDSELHNEDKVPESKTLLLDAAMRVMGQK